MIDKLNIFLMIARLIFKGSEPCSTLRSARTKIYTFLIFSGFTTLSDMTGWKLVPGDISDNLEAAIGCRSKIFGATTINGFLYGAIT